MSKYSKLEQFSKRIMPRRAGVNRRYRSCDLLAVDIFLWRYFGANILANRQIIDGRKINIIEQKKDKCDDVCKYYAKLERQVISGLLTETSNSYFVILSSFWTS